MWPYLIELEERLFFLEVIDGIRLCFHSFLGVCVLCKCTSADVVCYIIFYEFVVNYELDGMCM